MVLNSLSSTKQPQFFSEIKVLVVQLPISFLLDSLSLGNNLVVKPVFEFLRHVWCILAVVYEFRHLIKISIRRYHIYSSVSLLGVLLQHSVNFCVLP